MNIEICGNDTIDAILIIYKTQENEIKIYNIEIIKTIMIDYPERIKNIKSNPPKNEIIEK